MRETGLLTPLGPLGVCSTGWLLNKLPDKAAEAEGQEGHARYSGRIDPLYELIVTESAITLVGRCLCGRKSREKASISETKDAF